MTGAQLLIKALLDQGVEYVFGYTGGAIMPVFDEIAKKGKKLKLFNTRNEQGAAFMAQGVSRATMHLAKPKTGVCLATSGPGAMNLVTGVADAIMDSTPIISISGQVAKSVIGTDAFQETDVVGVMLPITKQVYMPLTPEEIEVAVHEAFFIARSGRPGPVHIDIPKDIQFASATSDYEFNLKTYQPKVPGYKVHNLPDQEDITAAVQLINQAKRPVIFCGHGVRWSNAGKELVKFAEKINAPIAATLHGISAFSSDHPLYLGWMGMHGTVEANRAIQKADLIIAFGMRFDDRVTGKLDEYAKNADVIHVEIDPSEIDKNVKTTIGMNADAKSALEAFLAVKNLQFQERKQWFQEIKVFKKETGKWHDQELHKGSSANGKLWMKSVITSLSDVTNGEDILVMDVGQNQMIASKYYQFKKENTAFNSGGAGTMGASLPMAVGVKIARPEETVWSICGDGGFQMNIQELGTVMEHNIDVKIVILNNGYLGMVRQWQTLFFDGRYAGTPMLDPDFSKIAAAYGIPFQRIEKIKDAANAFKTAKKHKGAYILEFICDPSELVLPMIPAAQPFEKMIINKLETEIRNQKSEK
ncbi:MAG: biosynthetic-type acetolactate synthase large subunit [bacterium]